MEWKSPLSDGGSKILKYIISQIGVTSEVKDIIMTVNGHEHSCTLKNLKQNLDYYFCIQAENKVGLSTYCDAEYAVTPMRALRKFCTIKICFLFTILFPL